MKGRYHAGGEQLRSGWQCRHHRLRQQVEDFLHERRQGQEHHEDRDRRSHQARPQFDQVRQEALLLARFRASGVSPVPF